MKKKPTTRRSSAPKTKPTPAALVPAHSRNGEMVAKIPPSEIGKADDRPSAMELAKLAAILAPNAECGNAMTRSMERAMEFYVEAVCFQREMPKAWAGLLHRFGSNERNHQHKAPEWQRALDEQRQEIWGDTLRLDPARDKAGDDPARHFLDELEYGVKGSRAIIDNLREYWEQRPTGTTARMSADKLVEKCTKTRNGLKTYEIPRLFLRGMVAFKKHKRSESRKKGAKTKKARAEAKKARAKRSQVKVKKSSAAH